MTKIIGLIILLLASGYVVWPLFHKRDGQIAQRTKGTSLNRRRKLEEEILVVKQKKQQTSLFCPQCRKPVHTADTYCANCGAKLNKAT